MRAMHAAAALWLLAALAHGALPPRPDLSARGLQLVYEDDFDWPLNERLWNKLDGYVQTPWDIVCYQADEAYTERGNLVLRTRRRDVVCGGKTFAYSSGWVDTLDKLSLRNGRIELSARLPAPAFRNWPAAWAISERNRRDTGELCWPLSTEVDVYEAAAGAPAASGLQDNAVCGSCVHRRAGARARGRASPVVPRPAAADAALAPTQYTSPTWPGLGQVHQPFIFFLPPFTGTFFPPSSLQVPLGHHVLCRPRRGAHGLPQPHAAAVRRRLPHVRRRVGPGRNDPLVVRRCSSV